MRGAPCPQGCVPGKRLLRPPCLTLAVCPVRGILPRCPTRPIPTPADPEQTTKSSAATPHPQQAARRVLALASPLRSCRRLRGLQIARSLANGHPLSPGILLAVTQGARSVQEAVRPAATQQVLHKGVLPVEVAAKEDQQAVRPTALQITPVRVLAARLLHKRLPAPPFPSALTLGLPTQWKILNTIM